MGRAGVEGVGPVAQLPLVKGVEFLQCDTELARIPSYFVEGDHAVVNVKTGCLLPL